MATKRKSRAHLRGTTPPPDLTESVMFRVKEISPKALASRKTSEEAKVYYAEALPQRTMKMADLLARMDRERARVSPHIAKMVLEVALETIVTMMREGKRVTLDGYFSFGVSVKGRITDPNHPETKNMELRPWVRCSPRVIDAVNQGAHIAEKGRTRVPSTDLFRSLRKGRVPKKRTVAADEEA